MWTRLKFSRTFWTGVGGILMAVGAVLSGEMTWPEAAPLIVIGLMAIFGRDSVAKLGK